MRFDFALFIEISGITRVWTGKTLLAEYHTSFYGMFKGDTIIYNIQAWIIKG